MTDVDADLGELVAELRAPGSTSIVRSAEYVRNMAADRLAAQQREIDQLNTELAAERDEVCRLIVMLGEHADPPSTNRGDQPMTDIHRLLTDLRARYAAGFGCELTKDELGALLLLIEFVTVTAAAERARADEEQEPT